MILARPQAQPSPYHHSELAPSTFSSPDFASPPIMPPRPGHKHSLSKTMIWLNRNGPSSNYPAPQAAPKPTRISEPKLSSSLNQLGVPRSGTLGSGATVVRTPQEALSGTSRAHEPRNEEQGPEKNNPLHNHLDENQNRRFLSIPSSPPLPPLPDISDANEGGEEASSRRCASPISLPLSDRVSHPRSSASPSPKPQRSSSRPTVQAHSRAPSRSIPTPPADPAQFPAQPPFEALLFSAIPDGPVDPSKLVVTLETCTTTYRTSLRTLVSRPSHLSRYITSLLSPISETASVYSSTSDVSLGRQSNGFAAAFRDHLASSGCLPQSFNSNSLHIFLDRPSGPYAHVLAYLRSLPGTPEQPETLPRAVQLGTHLPSRLESLLDLCDEASYLGLDALYKLCCHEINRAQRPPVAPDSLRGKTGSVRSFRTVVEQYQPFYPNGSTSELKGVSGAHATAKSATRESSSGSSCEHKDMVAIRERSRERRGPKYEVGSVGTPPPGWI